MYFGVRAVAELLLGLPELTMNRGAAMCIGGPALVMYVQPTEEELFKVCISFRFEARNRAITCMGRKGTFIRSKLNKFTEIQSRTSEALAGKPV